LIFAWLDAVEFANRANHRDPGRLKTFCWAGGKSTANTLQQNNLKPATVRD